MNQLVDKLIIEPQQGVAISVASHYTLNLYSAIYHLCFYIVKLSQVNGPSLESQFNRYPFLNEYFEQILSAMPRNLDWNEGGDWWRNSLIAVENRSNVHLPLKALRTNASLGDGARIALMIVGLMEEDSRFGTLISELQHPISARRPMLETLGHLITHTTQERDKTIWDICKPLLETGLLVAKNHELPRAEWVLSVNRHAWDLIRGNHKGDKCFDLSRSLHWRYNTVEELMSMDALVLDETLLAKCHNLPGLISAGRVETLILRAQEGSHTIDVVGAVARACSKSMIVVTVDKPRDFAADSSLGILCTMLNALPVFELDLAPGETFASPELEGFTGAKVIILGAEGGIGGIDSEQVISLSIPSPGPEQRALLWEQNLDRRQCEELAAVSTQFRLPGDYIRQVAQIAVSNLALEKRDQLNIHDIRVASRNLNRQKLDSLADPLDAKGHWSDLITVDSTSDKLAELQQRCVYREHLLDHLGPAFNNSSNCGVRALLTGRSGTGKTLSAKILAAEVGMDIYRVDLASIVNKYIGETEKNLHKVLSRAEALDVILLLDEGDALLGARTDVKSANDRYANLETNYLLQRLENYQGVVLITTNLCDNIDKAFQRRMDIVVPFFQPQTAQRLAIFYLHLPETHAVESVYLEQVAKYCCLMGGQIRNVCMHASLVALGQQQSVAKQHLEVALRSEYRKNGGTFPLDSHDEQTEFDGGMESFAQALFRS